MLRVEVKLKAWRPRQEFNLNFIACSSVWLDSIYGFLMPVFPIYFSSIIALDVCYEFQKNPVEVGPKQPSRKSLFLCTIVNYRLHNGAGCPMQDDFLVLWATGNPPFPLFSFGCLIACPFGSHLVGLLPSYI